MQSVSALLLAGGTGSRMGASLPKQFLLLHQKRILDFSLELLLSLPIIQKIVIVIDPAYRSLIQLHGDKELLWALPGERRQDSVENALHLLNCEDAYVCIHDGARPFVTSQMMDDLFEVGIQVGAAALGMPLKSSIKEIDAQGCVKRSLNREQIWETQTPQFLTRDLLLAGFKFAHQHHITVTDDVALAELVGHPVQLVRGCYTNLKITTPEDLVTAESLYDAYFAAKV